MLKHPVQTEARLRHAVVRIESCLYSGPMAIESAIWKVGGPPVPAEKALRAKYVPIQTGEAWGPLWDTAWFRFRGKIPSAWKGREVVALVRLADGGYEGFTAEALIYKEGKPCGALNVNRREVPVAKRAKGGESFEFFLEAASNGGMSPLGTTQKAKLNGADYGGKPLYKLEQAELVCVNRAAFDFYYDFKVALEAMEILPEDSQRRGELRHALNKAVNIFDPDEASSIQPARAVLQEVFGCKNGDTAHTISAVGHAHIDTAWLWPLRETIRKCARTFATALDYMDRYPEYVFVCSQAQQYAWIKAWYPDIWRRIKKAVARGQWEPVGSMWIETDCNLVSGESLVRQILHGKRFFQTELGCETRDVWIPDVFGYAASLPQIMKQAGIEFFLTQKISWNQFNTFPHHTFFWEGIDGTRIFSHFPPAGTYNADTGPATLVRSVKNFQDHGHASRSLLAYGFGDGGGGPTIEMLEKARRLRDFDGIPKLEPGKALLFFEKARADAKDLPVWVGELYLEMHRGTYTSQAKNKLGNRRSEFLLHDAEFFDAVSRVLCPKRHESAADPDRAVYDVTGLGEDGADCHARALDRAWKLVLLNQFHDIIPGSSIHWVYEDSEKDYETIRVLGESVRDSSLASLTPLIDTSGFSHPVLVANTLGMCRREVVELPNGRLTEVDVPPFGYVCLEGGGDKPAGGGTAEVTATSSREGIVLDNGLLRVTISSLGHIAGILDRAAEREVLSGDGNVFHLHEDIPNKFDAWDIDVFYREKCETIGGLESLELIETQPLRAAVRIVRTFGKSRIEQKIILTKGSRRLDFSTIVDWHENQKLLKVAFPVNIRSPRATYEIQFGHLERPTHANTNWDMGKFEVCAQKWADFSEPGYGVALLNDCKYGHDIQGQVMRLSLLRASVSPDPVADRGRHDFTYALLPHQGDLRQARVIEEAYALNVPLIVRPLKKSAGPLPPSHSFFQVSHPGVVIETVKLSEDRDAFIVRLYEAHGARGPVHLSTSLPVGRASLADLLEKKTSPLPRKSGGYRLEMKPFEIATIRFELA